MKFQKILLNGLRYKHMHKAQLTQKRFEIRAEYHNIFVIFFFFLCFGDDHSGVAPAKPCFFLISKQSLKFQFLHGLTTMLLPGSSQYIIWNIGIAGIPHLLIKTIKAFSISSKYLFNFLLLLVMITEASRATAFNIVSISENSVLLLRVVDCNLANNNELRFIKTNYLYLIAFLV